MQLKKIKLAGFKSFVDPTVIPIPSNLVAIVGPNGCGKSNIIDAVCWVMGESSAKYLRGASLLDVIFNGSSARKPVGQASVELVFDNQDGSLGGEYASYSEISIRRQISRDAESSYFLNGARCRRRDVIDIFLGTGLGPRSYSIIGQNMISRIIEAKPEEMRIYLEEAAGISKYKERRRETENRIQHTKENLERLNDVRLELDKQLGTLKRQSVAAEKFKLLKQEERVLRARWYVIQWREVDAELVDISLQIQIQATGLESCHAEAGDLNLQLDKQRQAAEQANELFQQVQRRYYAMGNDITRLEQDLRHQQERRQQWQTDIQQTEQDELTGKEHLDEAEEELNDLANELQQLGPAAETAGITTKEAVSILAQAEEAMHQWQGRWDEFNQRAAKTTQTAQVDQTRIQHLEQKFISLTQRQAYLEKEKNQFDFSKLNEEITVLTEKVAAVGAQTEEYNQQLQQVRKEISGLQSSQQKSTNELDKVRNELQRLRGQQSSLEALQKTALGQRNNSINQWLSQHNLDKKPRLAQGVEVEAGWENAVEKVLCIHLQAICIDELTDFAPFVDQFKQGTLSVVAKNTSSTVLNNEKNSLLSKVKSEWPLDSILAGIYIADSLEEAFTVSKTLAAHESVITRDGVWLGRSWLHILHDESPEAGIFQREQELKQLTQKIAESETVQAQLEKTIHEQRDQLKTVEKQQQDLQKTTNEFYAQSAEIAAQQKVKKERLLELEARVKRLDKEQEENASQREQTQQELTKVRSTWQQAMSELEKHAEQRESLIQERDTSREQLQASRVSANAAKDEAHQVQIRLQTTKSQQASLQQSVLRIQAQLTTLVERKTLLQNELNAAVPIDSIEKELNAALTQRLALEEELNNARKTLETINTELQSLEKIRQETEQQVSKFRDFLETLRVDQQGLKVKSETLMEQIKETGFDPGDILQNLPEVASAEECHQQLEQVLQRITRLGPINLVAIEECAACEERKQYLDKQYNDLQEGLNTLEDAISKIDKETRNRFKETFDKVNERFQELFPKVFGGGRASLELTEENLLETGITVMACPPGKRNSTIHLLSGGEKAMTAIALVFSIFHLNPAPFCLLDEVDAPLDDANVGRFCQLVKSMAEKTQFIFISHNKLAIEMGEHLIGVTMHEPGVSRLVSVDVQQAVSMAESTELTKA